MSDSVAVVHVVVPAHDEAALLPACLTSVAAAVDEVRRGRPGVVARLTVVLDACTDTSAQVCLDHGVDVLEVSENNVGAARAAGTARARRSAAADGAAPSEVWIACTDADSVVPVDWLTDQLDVAGAGADLVLGRAEPDATAPVAVVDRWHALHRDTVGVHGAHLGFRLSAHDAAGGWGHLAEHEDVDLVRRLLASGARPGEATRHVVTSSRLDGRTTGGYAGYLRALVLEAGA